MSVLLMVAVIIATVLYGVRVGNDSHDKWCVAVTCNMDSQGTEGTSAVKIHRKDRPEEY